MKRRWASTILAACLLSLGWTGLSLAQSYPTRPVRIIVPYPAGGSNDIMARIIAQNLSERLQKPFVVENRSGGGGNLGVEIAAREAPDGHTLLLAPSGPLTVHYALFKNLPINPATAFAPIALLGSAPILLVAHPSLPANNAAELVALAKAKPGQISYGSQGHGTSSHLATELFRYMTKIDLMHVPYRGAAPAMNDLIAGVIPMLFDSMPGVINQVNAGTIKALAIGAKNRSKLLPNVPTIDESAAKGYEASGWYGFMAPAATPAPILEFLAAEVGKTLKLPSVLARLDKLAIEPSTVTGAAFGQFLNDETTKWTKLIQVLNIKIP